MKKFLVGITTFAFVFSVTPMPSVWAGNAAAAAKSGTAVAFAKASIFTGTIQAFGGKGTTAAAVSYFDTNNVVDVTFTGKYPKDIDASKLIVNTTCQSSDYGVSNTQVVSANATQIVIEVYGWVSDTKAGNGETVFLTVFVGQ